MTSDHQNGSTITVVGQSGELPGEVKSRGKWDLENFKEPLNVFLGELLGTAVLVFCGCLCTLQIGSIPSPLAGAIGFGFTVSVVINIFGCITCAHVNPAVTVCAAIYGAIPYWMILVYIPAQIAGSLIGFGMLAASMPIQTYLDRTGNTDGICLTVPHPELSIFNAFICEMFLTMILILVCCGLWDTRNAKYQDSISIKFGLTIAALSIAGGNLTGASMNPARSFGPAVWNNHLDYHWIYWASPISSSVITTLAYKYVFRRDRDDSCP